MRQILLLMILAIFSSCGSIPAPPSIELCTLDIKNDVAYCAKTKRSKKKLKTRRAVEKPIDQLEKYVAVSPDDWGRVVKYIKLLKKALK